MAQEYDISFAVDVYRGRNNFLPDNDPSFAGDQQVTLSFGATSEAEPATKYGPYPRGFLMQFFPYLRSPILFARPPGLTDAVWATTVVNGHFNGAEHEFPPDVFLPIDNWFFVGNLTQFNWPLDFNDPTTPDIDMRETWILLDFLQASALKNAVLDSYFNHIKVDNGTPAYFRGKRYFIDRELIDYLFEHKLWITQFGRAVLYIIRKEIQEVATGHDEDTLDTELLPAWLENLLGGAEQDLNYLPWYFDLLRLILMEMVRPFNLPEEDDDSIAYFCGVAHHHPNEPRCRDPPEDGSEDGDGYGDGVLDGYADQRSMDGYDSSDAEV